MRLLCLAVLTLCAATAEAQPTLARDRAPAVPNGIQDLRGSAVLNDPRARAEAACQLRKEHRDATAAIPILLIDALGRRGRGGARVSHEPLAAPATAHRSRRPELVAKLAGQGSRRHAWPHRRRRRAGLVDRVAACRLAHAQVRGVRSGRGRAVLDREKVIAALADRLTDDHADVRERSAWALGEIEDAAAVPAVLRALHSDRGSPRARDRRVGAGRNRGCVRGQWPGVRCSPDPDVELRQKAVCGRWARLKIGPPSTDSSRC